MAISQAIDKGHGRIEIRRCWTMEQTEFLLGAEKSGQTHLIFER